MAEPSVETPTFIEEVFPDDDPENEAALLGSDALEEEDELELTVEPEPEPLGRSAAFDFDTERFRTSGHEPHPTRGLDTLRNWIEKCLRTEEGAHAIHPEGYGLRQSLDAYLNGDSDVSIGELEQDIIDALLYHPAISRVDDMRTEEGETPDGDRAANISFTVVTDDAVTIDIDTTLTAEEL